MPDTTKLENAKVLGGVGSILLILMVVPHVGAIIGIIGLVLVLIAAKYIADFFGRDSIFKNMLLSVIFGIIGLGVFLAAVFAGILSLGFRHGVVSGIAFLILALVLLFVFFIISAIFLRKSFNEISTVMGIGMFSTAGLLYLIGAALTIIVVGIFIILIAWVLAAVAFFSIEPSKYQAPAGPAPPPPPGPPPTPKIEEVKPPEPIEPS